MKRICMIILILYFASASTALRGSVSQELIDKLFPIYVLFGPGLLGQPNLGVFKYSFQSVSQGSVSFDLANFTLSKMSANPITSSLKFTDPNNIELKLSDIAIEYTFDGIIRLGMSIYEGNGTASIAKTDLSIIISPEVTSENKLNIKTIENTTKINYIDITAGEDVNFNRNLNHEVAINISGFESLFSAFFQNYLLEINKFLSEFSYTLPIEQLYMLISLNPTEQARLNATYMVGSLSGQVTSTYGSGKIYPVPEGVLPDYDSATPNEIQLFASEYVLQAGVNCIWSFFQYPLTSLPASLQINLTTSNLSLLIPGLMQTFGKDKNVMIVLKGNPDHYPIVKVNGSLSLLANITAGFLVEVEPGNYTQAVDLNTVVDADLNLSLKKEKGSLKINTLEIAELSYSNSNIGAVQTDLLKNLLNAVIKTYETPFNNVYSEFDVPMPSIAPLKIIEDNGLLKDGYLQLGFDITFTL